MNSTNLFIIFSKTAIVVFNHGAFGGAAKRYTQLYIELLKKYPADIFIIVNNHLYNQIITIFPEINTKNLFVIDKEETSDKPVRDSGKPVRYADHSPDPLEIDNKASFLRKVYWYYKNLFRQKRIYNKIESFREKLGIKVFIGVFSGGIPLTFYLKESPRKASVIFANMDSWFSDVHANMKKLWYRKYYSFNYIMEHSDYVDFLSPYIFEGVKKRNVNINNDCVSISPCSFIDYSKCKAGSKINFEIAFSARLEPDKNPMMYLEAVKILHNRYPGIKFHLLGEGTLVDEIDNYIKDNNLENAMNFCFHKNPPDIFAETSIFVSLQTGTNYPSQSVLEAMACENAIVASNTGDTNLFVNEQNGVMINLGVNDLVNALEKLINDNAYTKKLGKHARIYAMENHTSEKYLQYFTDLVNKTYLKHFS